jgi:hypothetical protein
MPKSTSVLPTRTISKPVEWILTATIMLMVGPLFAAADATGSETCPAAAAGTCPHAMGMGHSGMGMHGTSGGSAPMAMFERMGEELALTEAQKLELAALMEMYRPRIKELAQRGQESIQALMTMAPDDSAYNMEAANLSQQAGASAAEMVTLLTELQTNAYALLKSEQQATFMAKRAQQRERMQARKAEMEARRAAGEPAYGPGFGHGMGHHKCKACAWLEEDDKTQETPE